MKKAILSGLFLLAAPSWGAYQYYLTDNLGNIDPLKWTTAGVAQASQAGFAASDTAGGSLISRIPIPDGTSEAEVRTTLKLTASGGTYTSFLQASSDARTSGVGSGTYLAFEMQNPKFDSTGKCTANFALMRSVNGSLSLVTSFPHPCRNGMTLRMAVHGNIVLLWLDEDSPVEFAIPASGVGQPGIGSYGVRPGMGFPRYNWAHWRARSPPRPIRRRPPIPRSPDGST